MRTVLLTKQKPEFSKDQLDDLRRLLGAAAWRTIPRLADAVGMARSPGLPLAIGAKKIRKRLVTILRELDAIEREQYAWAHHARLVAKETEARSLTTNQQTPSGADVWTAWELWEGAFLTFHTATKTALAGPWIRRTRRPPNIEQRHAEWVVASALTEAGIRLTKSWSGCFAQCLRIVFEASGRADVGDLRDALRRCVDTQSSLRPSGSLETKQRDQAQIPARAFKALPKADLALIHEALLKCDGDARAAFYWVPSDVIRRLFRAMSR